MGTLQHICTFGASYDVYKLDQVNQMDQLNQVNNSNQVVHVYCVAYIRYFGLQSRRLCHQTEPTDGSVLMSCCPADELIARAVGAGESR